MMPSFHQFICYCYQKYFLILKVNSLKALNPTASPVSSEILESNNVYIL